MLIERIANGEDDSSRVFSHRLPLAEAPRGFEMFKHRKLHESFVAALNRFSRSSSLKQEELDQGEDDRTRKFKTVSIDRFHASQNNLTLRNLDKWKQFAGKALTK